MVFLKRFVLPTVQEEETGNLFPHEYPYGIFPYKKLREVVFGDITVFYGGNGSGKTTLLNLIAQKLNLPRQTPYNSSSFFLPYVQDKCSFEKNDDIPYGSKIITSDDIFQYIIHVRDDNIRIGKEKQKQEEEYDQAKYSPIRFRSLGDYEQLKKQNDARGHTKRKFVSSRTEDYIDMFSNGETALAYFDRQFASNALYLLDEPENSLSPDFQMQLAKLVLQCVFYCGCQFVIATHSPFLLSLQDARVYDLDCVPAAEKKWYELDGMKQYYALFKKNEQFFQ